MNDDLTIAADSTSMKPALDEGDTLNNEISNEFYIVSRKKLLALYFCTLGFYSIYWFYKNWKLQKMFLKESYWSPMRGIFYIFFTHDLFRKVDKKLRDADKKYHWDCNGLATQIVILTIASNILGRLSMQYIGSPYTDMGSLALSAGVGILLLNAQNAINVACNDSDGQSNTKFSGSNIFWIITGIILTLLSLFAIFFTDANT